MYLKNIHLYAFRNYHEQTLNFESQKTILLGNNAQGKSNLLEAVELLATLKSHRTNRDRDLILEGEKKGQILGTVERNYGESQMGITFRSPGRRSLMLNHENLRRHLEFLGHINAVEFSCLDLELVRGSPETRRSWLDTLLIQLEPVYASIINQYNKVLRQRNALLKVIRKTVEEQTNTDNLSAEMSQLKLWDQQLAEAGTRVTRRRNRVIERISPLAENWHKEISNGTEKLEINYLPNISIDREEPQEVQQAFLDKIEQRRMAEQQLATSVVGPHRDDVELKINHTPAKSYGSQGQQRTLVLAIKLAELQLIEDVIGEPPLLLLDDVLAELDPNRQNQLLEVIQGRFQTIITTTYLHSFDTQWLKSSQIMKVEGGKLFQM
ncbi:DNA replication/repair protein RecF [Crocosphaera watsonii WH 8501]|uniref:DNA replication and repair protein RecF n=4 Tax=Crocosphaera watsonii TaxID=263511 RepID=Q4BX47_CROWT|nr:MULTISPECIES: DNA replication/repair protein RecF [Crocosphaera]EAM48480.1 RecF protein [Crocosphaera watsonii WH 8501]EHJ10238.1 DNA recombination and repair protein RecF [Crocosphaera watsonii WH 0003]MCH2247801.1 DNA replication/repair protein RecF [Crocosphaera sp.]NQZ64063.1 DNA replication/repair protein RecF [Crocosphaera sp.]CCQ53722.1 DNA recombination and repair protein RecF [Crocosphaera watsonii WH 0005]